jgi:hypothetical protein
LYFKNKPKQYFIDKLLQSKENTPAKLNIDNKKEGITIGNATKEN